jgi:3-oxoadipate enol-lactonase
MAESPGVVCADAAEGSMRALVQRVSQAAVDVEGERVAQIAPSLLLINGYAATAADWDPTFIAALERSFELILPDNRGVGAAPLGELDRPLTIEAMAADLEALLDARGIERLSVAGWSMGGFVAQQLATRAPRRVEALVLLSTDPGGPDAVLSDPAVWTRLTDRSGTPREQATRMISLLFPPATAAEIDAQFGDVVATARAALAPAALAAQEAAMDAWHAEEQPTVESASPALIVHGSEDIVIPPENGDRLAARWPDSRVERFEGGGHAFMAQEPERLADLITSFLLR